MVDQFIQMDTQRILAAPARLVPVVPLKKYIMPTDRTTNNLSIFGDHQINLQWEVLVDQDPNHYFTETEQPSGTTDGVATGAFTTIAVNYAGYYMIQARATARADGSPSDFYRFYLVMDVFDQAGFSPTYGIADYSFNEFGSGTFPTGVSTVSTTIFANLNADSNFAIYASTLRSVTIPGGAASYKETHLTVACMGIRDPSNSNGFISKGDPFYRMKNLSM